MQDWLARLAEELRRDFPALPSDALPSPRVAGDLLKLAKIVADGTGQKLNAPLTCYLAGHLASALRPAGTPPEEAVVAALSAAKRILASDS